MSDTTSVRAVKFPQVSWCLNPGPEAQAHERYRRAGACCMASVSGSVGVRDVSAPATPSDPLLRLARVARAAAQRQRS